jgi:hypothetical protein
LQQAEKPDGYTLYTLRVSENDEFPSSCSTACSKLRRPPHERPGWCERNPQPTSASEHRARPAASTFRASRVRIRYRAARVGSSPTESTTCCATSTSGTAESSGGGATHDRSGELISASSNVRVILEREIELAERLLATALFWSRAPAETLLWSGNQHRPLRDSDPAPTPLHVRAQRFEVSTAGARAGMEALVHYVPEPLRPANATSIAIASKADSAPNDDGDQWLGFDDGGKLRIRPTGGTDAVTGLGCRFEELSLDACRFVLDSSRADELLLVPMMLTASETLARTLAGVWPGTRYVGNADELLEILRQGPRVWWERHGPAVLAKG